MLMEAREGCVMFGIRRQFETLIYRKVGRKEVQESYLL